MSKNQYHITRLFEPIESKDLSVLVFEQIMDLIYLGVLKIGDQLPNINELQLRMNVGKTYIKKALKRLVSLGIIKSISDEELIIADTKEKTKSMLPNKKNFIWVDFDAEKIKRKKYRIGFSQTTLNHPARQYMDSKFNEYAKLMGVEAITTDAQWSVENEISNIHWLISQKVDGIIISTHSGNQIRPAIFAASKANIPTLLFSSGQPFNNAPFSILATTDDWQLGRIAGYFMCNFIGGVGEIAQIEGTPGSSITDGRRDGILGALDDFPDIHLIASTSTKWKREPSVTAALNIIKKYPHIKAIITHCDEQAMGAVDAVKILRRDKEENHIFIFSVSDCQKEAFDLIRQKRLMLTLNFEQDGAIALNIMLQLLEKKKPPRLINLGTYFVTHNTINNFKPNF